MDNAGTETEKTQKLSTYNELVKKVFKKHFITTKLDKKKCKKKVQLKNNYPDTKAQLSSLQRRLSSPEGIVCGKF